MTRKAYLLYIKRTVIGEMYGTNKVTKAKKNQ